MNPSAERRLQDNAPIAHFIDKILNNDTFIRGNVTGCFELASDVIIEDVGCLGFESMITGQQLLCIRSRGSREYPGQRADCPAKFKRSTDSVAAPKWHLALFSRCRLDQDLVFGNFQCAPH